jgi:hypothetical protein
MDNPPDWIPRLLADWQRTLLAYESDDIAWLARHLDAFAKHELYKAVLRERGCSWSKLSRRRPLADELALLDQSYHEFCHEDSVFHQLEQAGLLDHRVGPRIDPGQEADPYVPEVATRARPRAIFIRDHPNRSEFSIDWSCIHDRRRSRVARLDDPFAWDLGEWVAMSKGRRPHISELADPSAQDEIQHMYDHGRYEQAYSLLLRNEMLAHLHGEQLPGPMLRQKAWLHARCGLLDGQRLLSLIYGEPPTTLVGVNDYCNVFRFDGLCPRLEPMLPWIDRGQFVLQSHGSVDDVEQAAVFREHAAVTFARNGRTGEALELLAPALAEPARRQTSQRLQAQLLATLGETYRRAGRAADARQVLLEAMHIQLEHDHSGYLSYCTWLSLAKNEDRPADGIRWLRRALELQRRNRDRVASVATLALEARMSNDSQTSAGHKNQLLTIRNRLPALRQCPALTRIVEHWDAWINADHIDRAKEDFWGL